MTGKRPQKSTVRRTRKPSSAGKKPARRAPRKTIVQSRDQTDKAVRVIDVNGTIVDVNDAYCRIVSRSPEELIGLPFVEVYAEPIRTAMMAQYLQRVSVGTLEPDREQRVYLWNGDEMWLEASDAYVQKPGDPPLVRTTFRNMTPRRLASQNLREARQLESIREAQMLYISGADPRHVFDRLLQILLELTESRAGFLHEIRRDSDSLPEFVLLASRGDEWARDASLDTADSGAGADVVHNLRPLFPTDAQLNRLLIINTMDHDDRRLGTPFDHPAVTTFMAIPLLFGGQIVGLASMANRAEGYQEGLASHLGPFSSTCAAIIHAVGSARKEAAYVRTLREREENLRKNERTISSIFRAAPTGIGRTVNRVLMDVNDRLCSMTGYTREELVGQNARLLYPTQEDYDYVGREKYAQIAAQGTGTVTTRWRRKDGQTIDVLLSSTALTPGDELNGVTFTALDVTEQRRNAEAVRLSEERYRMVVETSQDGISLTDLEGCFTFCNSRMAAMLGCGHPDDLVGQSAYRFIVPEEVPTARDVFGSLLSHRTMQGTELTVLRNDGLPFPAEFNSSLLEDATGSPVGMMFVVRDITERIEAEDQLRASLREKEVLLKEIHHRVKNNLQVISSLLSLQASSISDAATREMFRESQNRVRSMALVHERLYRSENLTEIDFGEYVRAVTSHLIRSYGRPGIVCHVDAHDVFLSIDTAIPCGLIVNELVSNALKHAFPTGDTGSVRLDVTLLAPARACLSIRDNGVGLPPDLDWRQATSMGMTLVNNLAEQLGGTLTHSRDGGTAFRLEFPLIP